MLQYILNVSAIWLLSLAVFDIFLRRDTYHGYNRTYLLLTLLAGVFLPLISLQVDSVPQRIADPVINTVNTMKQSITSNTPSSEKNSISWLLIVYLAGVIVSFALLLKEVFELSSLYRSGKKSKDGVWVIIETGKEHTPFSAFRYVFISSLGNYDETELRMILSHEEQHGHLLHFLDLLLVQLVRIIFWFNPLVYIYLNRLLIIHEYQADRSVDGQPATYGRFLVEQSMLASAPSLSHSFNRSPVKKRILMLTKRSTALSGSKKILIIPVLTVCVLCFSKDAFSDDEKKIVGNKLIYRGNVFEMTPATPPDTFMVQDPVSGDMVMKIATREPRPITMNEKHIYKEEDLTQEEQLAVRKGALKEIATYLMYQAENEIKALPDGIYRIGVYATILDKTGKVVYDDGAFIMWYGNKANLKAEDAARKIGPLLEKAIRKEKTFPKVMRNGDAVIYSLSGNAELEIKNHIVTLK